MSELCNMCGGEPALLGKLGRLTHVRCIQCGWEWSFEEERDHCPECSIPTAPMPEDAKYEERLCNGCHSREEANV